MITCKPKFVSYSLPLAVALTVLGAPEAHAQISGDKAANFAQVFNVGIDQKPQGWSVQETGSSLGANLLHPGDTITLTLRFASMGNDPITGPVTMDVIPYDTSVAPGDVWMPVVFPSPDQPVQHIPLPVQVDAHKAASVSFTPTIPDRFGTYAVVADLGAKGRVFVGSVARTVAPDDGFVPFPACSLDLPHNVNPSSMAMFKGIGVKASRMEIGPFDTTAPDAAKHWADLDAKFGLLRQNNVTVMLTVDNGTLAEPTGRTRPFLSDDGILLNTKADDAWLPSEDPKFQEWVHQMASRYGYPKGPINAMELWNEPWEGISISGWGADMLRYREMFKAMGAGLAQARADSGVTVLQGGASSSSNTLDKLFPDGSTEMLPLLDFCSIHYQIMAAAPSLIKMFRDRKPAPVQTWDTETWVANSGDRLAAVIASMRAMGQERVLGVYYGNVYGDSMVRADGQTDYITQAWSGAPAYAAVTKFIGNRNFTHLLFNSGLPWVFAFDAAPKTAEAPAQDPEQGTLVVVGDLSGDYDPNLVNFRDVVGLNNPPLIAAAQKAYDALDPNAGLDVKNAADVARKAARILRDATLTFSSEHGKFREYDFDGNLLPAPHGEITVPLNSWGYYLRTDGSPGSFAALETAVASARISGYQPLHVVAHDFIAPLATHPSLRVGLTNILNRPVTGTLNVSIPGLTLTDSSQKLTIAPGATTNLSFAVTAGNENAANTYPLTVTFNAGKDGSLERDENLHCNVITHQTIAVDGDLTDWKGAYPQPAGGAGIAAGLTEKAWLPFQNFDQGAAGVASGYLAYDDNNLYFAAKIADSTPDNGTVNFAKRNDDDYFYPDTAYSLNPDDSLQKKDTVLQTGLDQPHALQTPDGTGRVLGQYETTTTKAFAADVTPAQGTPVQVALYFADNSIPARRDQNVEMLDPTGKVLDTQNVKFVDNGTYLIYNVTGPVRFKFVTPSWMTAELSGVFFDPAPAGATTGYVSQDITTAGMWRGKYGSLGYHLAAENMEKLPAGLTLTFPEVLDKQPVVWPDGVRHYSYRKRPDLPFNTGDDVQIAFNVLPDDQKPWLMNPPGVPPKWMLYPDTDYEYELAAIKPEDGGGTEVWRLNVPGMPHKHFYPRQPIWAGDAVHKEGIASGAKLVMKRDDTTRYVELALPWSEIPEIKAKLDAHQTIKFSYRIGDNMGKPYELAQDRSVSKVNFYAFHPDFATHWANELEFGWGQ